MCVCVRIYKNNCVYIHNMQRITKTIISKFKIKVEMQELEEAKVNMVYFS